MNAINFSSDIPLSLAESAHSGTSFSPERRGAYVVRDYSERLASEYAQLQKLADTPEKQAELETEFTRYREGVKKRTLALLHSKSRVVSWFIAGPSNFPAHRMNKRSDVVHRRLNELLEFRERALKAIRNTLCPGYRPIMAGDADAVERLDGSLRDAEEYHQRMLSANKAIRAHAKDGSAAQVAALVLLGFGYLEAQKLLVPDFCGRIGFADYELTNNGANIRRMRKRLESVRANKARKDEVIEGENGVRYEDAPADNRVRLFFAGKPDASVRDELKGRGFRWAPSLGCWQAYRNYQTVNHARRVAGIAGEVAA